MECVCGGGEGGSPGEGKTLSFMAQLFKIVLYMSSSHHMFSSLGVEAEMSILRNGGLEERRSEIFYSPF